MRVPVQGAPPPTATTPFDGTISGSDGVSRVYSVNGGVNSPPADPVSTLGTRLTATPVPEPGTGARLGLAALVRAPRRRS